MDPPPPDHQSSSGGLLPAFNGNTKPLKYRDFAELLCRGILCKAARGKLSRLAAKTGASTNATKYVVMDVANEASVIAGLDGCEQGFGPVRGLVNSAGIARDVPFFDTSVELFRKVLDINLIGTFTVAREAGRLMRAHGGGAIVNIASISGQRGNLGRSAYGASKGGVITLTQVMACELAPENIRVNAIAPGPVETPLVRAMQSEANRSRLASGGAAAPLRVARRSCQRRRVPAGRQQGELHYRACPQCRWRLRRGRISACQLA
jgi:NAD(P)-dependent dehydrogenase (short-subunit alcohol dehydrogenase family)